MIETFLKREDLSIKEIDLVILGLNGDSEFDPVYYELMETLFTENRQTFYKHLCGEYHTSSSFALWLSAMIIRYQKIPEIIEISNKPTKEIKNILIYNQYRNVNHCLILVSSQA